MNFEDSHQIHFVKLQDLRYRFYVDGKVSKYACLLENTPHYEMAKAFLAGRESTGRYEKYINYARQFYEQSPEDRHSLKRFKKMLTEWAQSFDLDRHLIEVATKNEITFIVGGAHRAAFALAKQMFHAPVVFTNENWTQNVEKIDSIEDVFPLKQWVVKQS